MDPNETQKKSSGGISDCLDQIKTGVDLKKVTSLGLNSVELSKIVIDYFRPWVHRNFLSPQKNWTD